MLDLHSKFKENAGKFYFHALEFVLGFGTPYLTKVLEMGCLQLADI
jgi:hypothetical protein